MIPFYISSSRGPSNCDEVQAIFPEIVAPGVNIHTNDLFDLYTDATGTSLAAPNVAGGLALLLNAFPDLSAIEQVLAFITSAVDLGESGPDNDFGCGPSSEWIYVDLGKSTSITEVVLKWDLYYPTSCFIQTSGDGIARTTVFIATNGNGGEDVITLSLESSRYEAV